MVRDTRQEIDRNASAVDVGPPDAKSDTLGGIIMLSAAALALVWANSPWAASYGEALSFTLGLSSRDRIAPEGANWLQLLGIAHLCGIGFTMSLLVAVLAYETQAPHLFEEAKLGVLVGSTLGAIAGVVVLLLAPRPRTVTASAIE